MSKTKNRSKLNPNYIGGIGRSHFSCSFTITQTQMDAIDQLIESDLYASKSEIVRMAINDFLIKHADLLEKI